MKLQSSRRSLMGLLPFMLWNIPRQMSLTCIPDSSPSSSLSHTSLRSVSTLSIVPKHTEFHSSPDTTSMRLNRSSGVSMKPRALMLSNSAFPSLSIAAPLPPSHPVTKLPISMPSLNIDFALEMSPRRNVITPAAVSGLSLERKRPSNI